MSLLKNLSSAWRRFWLWLDKQDLPQSCGCLPVDQEKINADRAFSLFEQKKERE